MIKFRLAKIRIASIRKNHKIETYTVPDDMFITIENQSRVNISGGKPELEPT